MNHTIEDRAAALLTIAVSWESLVYTLDRSAYRMPNDDMLVEALHAMTKPFVHPHVENAEVHMMDLLTAVNALTQWEVNGILPVMFEEDSYDTDYITNRLAGDVDWALAPLVHGHTNFCRKCVRMNASVSSWAPALDNGLCVADAS